MPCVCASTPEHWFFLNIKYDQRASEPRISGKKLVSRRDSGGTTQQIFEFDVYTKPNVPLGKLLSLYGKAEFDQFACCLSPIGPMMIDMSNIQLEYRGTNQPLDEQLLNTAIGSIINVPEQSMPRPPAAAAGGRGMLCSGTLMMLPMAVFSSCSSSG